MPGEVLAHCSSGCYGGKARHGSPMPNQRPIFRITYQRPWGQCVVNTAQFQTEAELRVGFAKSYPGCELVLVEDVTKYFLPKAK